jgi:O-antigen/teichoic acid export membrane protein
MNKLFKAMFCVTFFSICTRALGFLLKIYLSRELGSVLLGNYQVTMSIFGVLMTLLSSGIPVVLSRNVSYYSHNKNKKCIGSIVSSGLILTTVICLIVSIFIICFPDAINSIISETDFTNQNVIVKATSTLEDDYITSDDLSSTLADYATTDALS